MLKLHVSYKWYESYDGDICPSSGVVFAFYNDCIAWLQRPVIMNVSVILEIEVVVFVVSQGFDLNTMSVDSGADPVSKEMGVL